MIRKNIQVLLVLSVVLMTGVSCSGFLDEVPKSEIALETYFTDKEHAYTAINRLYKDGPHDLYGGYGSAYSGTLGMVYDHHTGFFDNEYKGQEPYVIAAQNLNINDSRLNDVAMDIWENQYFEIANANTAIKGIPNVPDLSDEEKDYQIAQAKFFRAFSYFILVRTFGDVPLITEPYEKAENLYIPRTPSLEVYNQIIEDLNFAVEHLNGGKMSENGDRVTSGAAQTLLAEVYLTMSGYPLNNNKYADAAREAKAVISTDTYELLENDDTGKNSAYNKMRQQKNDITSNEYIYYIEYLEDKENNPYAKWSLPLASDSTSIGIHLNTFGEVQEFIDLYDASNDLRVQENQFYHTSYKTQDFNTWAPWLWFDDYAHETSVSSKNFVVYRYTDVLLIAAEAIVMSGGSQSEAAGYLAQVKARASLNQTEAEIIAYLNSLSVQDFVEEVWSERYRECALEFKSWFTMLRTRQYPVGDGAGNVNYVDLIGHTNHWGATYGQNDLLWQIPAQEVQRNPALEFNP